MVTLSELEEMHDQIFSAYCSSNIEQNVVKFYTEVEDQRSTNWQLHKRERGARRYQHAMRESGVATMPSEVRFYCQTQNWSSSALTFYTGTFVTAEKSFVCPRSLQSIQRHRQRREACVPCPLRFFHEDSGNVIFSDGVISTRKEGSEAEKTVSLCECTSFAYPGKKNLQPIP